MLTQRKLMNLQDDGEFIGFARQYLTACNKAINEAKRATPEDLRHLFVSRIFATDVGYRWTWYLKG